MVIQQIDESLQLVAKQKRAKLLAISFLNIDQRMFTVEMGDDEVPRRRDAQRLGEVFRILQVNQRLAFLLNRKYLYGSQPRPKEHDGLRELIRSSQAGS